ncbi:MAG: Gmad2 immunoglobulin-like domain-containing protein [Anaerolineae bacterium]|nr:hypothetical protein [Anaerolineae bacterium]
MRLRIIIMLLALAVATLACNLTGSTSGSNNAVSTPVIGLQPLSGPPGTVITVAVSGFTPGALVNLLALPEGQASPTVLARDLLVGASGSLNFALSLPAQIGTTALTRTTALTLTVATADQRELASAVFVALISSTGTPSSTLAFTPTQGSLGGGGVTQNLYITAPAINSVHTATQITVIGSGVSFNNQVNVQLQDINNNVIASGVATIQGASGALGTWQVTIGFTQPAQRSSGFIYAFTLTSSGALAQASSIPIVYAGAGAGGAVTITPGGATPNGITPAVVATQLPIEILITNTPRP